MDFTEINKKRAFKLLNKFGPEELNNARKVKEIAKEEYPKSFKYAAQADSYLEDFVNVFKQVWYENKQNKVDGSYITALTLEKTKIEAEIAYLQFRLQYIDKELNK